MSDDVATRHDLLPLPGFPADAVPFAIRTTAALLLGYFVSFAIQLDTASSAGVCVAIVAQPSPGMALSKAFWRTAGTLLGGAVALAFIAAFAQDRTMLLLAFTLWLGVCTFTASLLRDFRSYGAVLSGYTVGIIAISGIDSPDGALLATLNRVAAILIGIASVAVVNLLLARPAAFESLRAALQAQLAAVTRLAIDTLEGRATPGEWASVQMGTPILALQTEATYAASELHRGTARRGGAMAAIAGLLGMLTASRAIAAEPPNPAADAWRARGAALLRSRSAAAPLDPPATAAAAFAAERTQELLAQHAAAVAGLRAFATGGRVLERVRLSRHNDRVRLSRHNDRVRLSRHNDVVGATLSAVRTMIAVGGGCLFCVTAGWPGSTGLLVQQAAFTALLGMTPNPTAAGEAMGVALVPAAIATAVVGFVLLPLSSGFVPFALVVAPVAFALALAGRYPGLQRFSAGFLLYFTLLLSPSNVESFDLGVFLNNLLVQCLAIAFMVLAFRLVLPVSRRRRLFRIAEAVMKDLRCTLRRGRSLQTARTNLREYDRMAQAELWAGQPTPARRAVLRRLGAMIDLDLELRRAWSGLLPALPASTRKAARSALLSGDPARLSDAADLLCQEPAGLQAASGLHAAARLMTAQRGSLRHYGVGS